MNPLGCLWQRAVGFEAQIRLCLNVGGDLVRQLLIVTQLDHDLTDGAIYAQLNAARLTEGTKIRRQRSQD